MPELIRTAEYLRRIEQVACTAYYCPEPVKDHSPAQKLGLVPVPTADELLRHTEVLVLAGVTDAGLIREALRAGRHVFAGSVRGLGVDELGELAGMAAEANVRLQFGLNNRFNPAFEALQAKPLAPVLIESERHYPYHPAAVLSDLILADIDLVMDLVNSEVKRISASGARVISDSADLATARLEFANGCVANIRINRIAMEEVHRLQVFLPESYFTADLKLKRLDRVYFRMHEHPQAGPQDIVAAIAADESGLIAVEHLPVGSGSATEHALRHFFSSVRSGEGNRANAYETQKTADVALRILKKINTLGEEQ